MDVREQREPRLGLRIKALREKADISQEQMARLLGIGSHQIVSQIESGERRLRAEELLKIVEVFAVPLEALTNPFLISGEGRFSWRQKNVSGKVLDAYELKAGEWVGAYRALRRANREPLPALQRRLGLDRSSRFEDAVGAADALVEELDLGARPAIGLARAMEEKLGILVLMVAAERGISGAACQLPELGAALVNRAEPRGRRSFDLAHELFHILTWTTMPPERLDGETPKNRRVEQLADSFASALLAPSRTLEAMGEPSEDLAPWLNRAAGELEMSAVALRWRLVNSGRLAREAAFAVPEEALRHNGEADDRPSAPPPLFGKAFAATLAQGIEKGNVSARRAAKLTGLDFEDLGDLIEQNGLSRPEVL